MGPHAQSSGLPKDYPRFLGELKERIRAAQVKASIAVNRELIALYWDLGKSVVERQQGKRWGTSVIERIADDLRKEFPGMRGLSASNIWRMRAFYLAWTGNGSILARPVREFHGPSQRAGAEWDGKTLPEVLAGLPWGQNITLLEKLESPWERLWYARQALEHGWSRPVLIHQIETGLHLRQGKALTNFHLLELGTGFAFIGRQCHIEVGGEDFFFDLLFYHVRLRCYVVIELKAGPFKPEHAGKMSFYLSAVDDLLKHTEDRPTIGIILCRSKNRVVAEYALHDSNKPIGVASYRATRALPEELKMGLPDVRELEEGLGS